MYNYLTCVIIRFLACNSTDGLTCDNPTIESTSSLSIGVIVVIVIIPIVIFVIVGIILFLIIMWKFKNDIFNKYICCCIYGSSKAQVNSLKQEIQRLQTELSQQKLNSSGRFSQLAPCMQLTTIINLFILCYNYYFNAARQQSQVSLMQQPRMSFSSNKIVPDKYDYH